MAFLLYLKQCLLVMRCMQSLPSLFLLSSLTKSFLLNFQAYSQRKDLSLALPKNLATSLYSSFSNRRLFFFLSKYLHNFKTPPPTLPPQDQRSRQSPRPRLLALIPPLKIILCLTEQNPSKNSKRACKLQDQFIYRPGQACEKPTFRLESKSYAYRSMPRRWSS